MPQTPKPPAYHTPGGGAPSPAAALVAGPPPGSTPDLAVGDRVTICDGPHAGQVATVTFVSQTSRGMFAAEFEAVAIDRRLGIYPDLPEADEKSVVVYLHWTQFKPAE